MRESSPLQIFVKAKKKINDIFIEIEDYVKDTVRFTKGVLEMISVIKHSCHLHSNPTPYFLALQEKNSVLEAAQAEQVAGYVQKVQGIRDVLTRDHMKVAFFGRCETKCYDLMWHFHAPRKDTK